MREMQIAIDGPASAGKSTVAKILAHDLHFIYCDTGAMYRAVTLEALRKGVAVDDGGALAQLLEKMTISFQPSKTGQKVFVNGDEVTDAIRQPDVTNNVSAVSAQGLVRQELVKRQQKIADQGGIVMDGRDIGTAVLPDAEVKIFLVASPEERAQRRYKENIEKGIQTPLNTLIDEIKTRDYKDSTRAISPLTKADDAVLVDTSGHGISEVVSQIKEIITKKLK